MAEVVNHVAALRKKRGLSAIQLAERAGVSRQTVYSMESGAFTPNTAVALRLARALETTVEELFTLPEPVAPPPRPQEATLLDGDDSLGPGRPVQLCRVGGRLIANAPPENQWYFPDADGVLAGKRSGKARAKVRLTTPAEEMGNRLLVAGCDPGISVLARHLRNRGVEPILAHRNSSQALTLLRDGLIHIAGTHLHNESSGESNIAEIGHFFPRNDVAVFSFAIWEEGIVTLPGNPKSIGSPADFGRADTSLVNREKGSGARRLLDSRLRALGIRPTEVRGYDSIAHGHLAACAEVRARTGDCCIATRAAADFFGLHFVPLLSERYDLAIRRTHLDFQPVQILLDTLNRATFRRALESLGGYDAQVAGTRVR